MSWNPKVSDVWSWQWQGGLLDIGSMRITKLTDHCKLDSFERSPRGWAASNIKQMQLKLHRKERKEADLQPAVEADHIINDSTALQKDCKEERPSNRLRQAARWDKLPLRNWKILAIRLGTDTIVLAEESSFKCLVHSYKENCNLLMNYKQVRRHHKHFYKGQRWR